MANNYEEVTVTPSIPKALVTPLEIALLQGFGFHCEDDTVEGAPALYFYTEDSGTSDDFSGDLPPLSLATETDNPELVRLLETFYAGHGIPQDCGEEEAFYDDLPVGWQSLLQTVVKRMQAQSPTPVALCVEAAFHCSRTRPGEFGGWVSVISADNIQTGSTKSLMNSFLKNL